MYREPPAWRHAKTPSCCCCLALDVLAGKDLLKSSFIAGIPSSHNRSLKTLTGSLMLNSPQDALSYSEGQTGCGPGEEEGLPVTVFCCLLLLLGLFSNISHTQTVFSGFTHHQNFCIALFQRQPFLIQSMTVGVPPVSQKGLTRVLFHGTGEQWFEKRTLVLCWESALMRFVEQHVAPACCLGMKKGHTATLNSAVSSVTSTMPRRGMLAISVWHTVLL